MLLLWHKTRFLSRKDVWLEAERLEPGITEKYNIDIIYVGY